MSAQTTPFQPVSPSVNLNDQEQNILSLWRTHKTFEKSLEATKNKPLYSFYDGPPFATGLPHYGHLMASVQKDIVPRYWTMKGYHVPRRFGWDCHGLPVEYEINKSLNIEDRRQVLAMGIDKYNDACRGIVQRYSSEWKSTIERVGRWVDMENSYFTMNPDFMSSVWWVFKQMWDKGLIYEGYKVVPYSIGVSTPLSNFEANLNYQDVQDPAVTVSFKIDGQADTYILAWTTTPWTLPSNLALAVGREIDYVKVKDTSNGKTYIVAAVLKENFFPAKETKYEVTAEIKGASLIDLTYEPLLPYFAKLKSQKAFRVIHSDHVTVESGTGVVHMAPAFGEDDFYACKAAGLPIVNPVDDDGRFTNEVSDFHNRRVKEADKDIIALLKKNGSLFKQDTIVHSYPFCWRSNTPLIYRAVSSWFVKVEEIKEQLLKANAQTRWVPDHLRDGRFGKWLENARDWAISRNRFWGTPLPVWKNDDGEMICVGSAEELAKLSGQKVTDLHMEFVDKITIPSPTGKRPLKRIESVLDCWFESGSMPYAQLGYPAQNKEQFEKGFPADFIAEGLDQTRGWFYTLMVISTALFNKPAFKNVIVNGLILAEDGKKMSKSLRNYPDPNILLEKYGADALRLYLIDSPVVKAQELRFSEKGVHDVARKILIRWWNAYSFFVSYANVDKFVPKGDAHKSPNILDKWIRSRLNTVIENTNREMAAYRLYTVVPKLLDFVEDLTNTYIRFNRSHFWADGMPEDKRLAYETLYEVLMTFSRVMAPFAPFMSETIFQNLAKASSQAKSSVHLESFPEVNEKERNPALEESVAVMAKLVEMGRNLREDLKIKAKIPLKSLKVIHRDQKILDGLKTLEAYFTGELNVREVIYSTEEDKYISLSAKPNFPKLGKVFGPRMKEVQAQIQALSKDQILGLEDGATIEVLGQKLTAEDLDIRRTLKIDSKQVKNDRVITIEFDTSLDPDQIEEGLAREIIRKIQQHRKNSKLNLDDRIKLTIKTSDDLTAIGQKHKQWIMNETLALDLQFGSASGAHIGKFEIGEDTLEVGLTKS